MPFRDEYTDFTFNGKTSEQMKVWITNSRDIQFRLTPEFTDTFVSPAFSNSQVLTGTNITKSTFQLKCIAIDVSMGEWRAIQRWLSPDAVGRLEFNFNYDTYYNAKVSKSITGKSFVKGGYDKLLGDLYIVEFTVDFTTVDDYAALGPVNVGVINTEKYSTELYLEGAEYILTKDGVTNRKITQNQNANFVISDLEYDTNYYLYSKKIITYIEFYNQNLDGKIGAISTFYPREDIILSAGALSTGLNGYFLSCWFTDSDCKTPLPSFLGNATLSAGKVYYFKMSNELHTVITGNMAGLHYNSPKQLFVCGRHLAILHYYYTKIYKSKNDCATANNSYFLPTFTKESNTPKNIGNKTIKFSLPSSSITSSTTGVLAYYFRPGDEQKETVANYNAGYVMKLGTIDTITKTCYLDIYGSRDGGDSLGAKIASIQLTCPSGSTTYVSDDVSVFSEDIFYRKVNDNLNITFSNQTNYYHICNTGSYDMYPEFYVRPNSGSTSFSIQYNQQDHYKYIYAFNSSSYVTINGRHGLVLSGNTLAEEVYVYNTNLNDNTVQRKAMFGNAGRVNQGIMAIPPGNAESLRCIVTKIEDVKITSTDNTGDLKLLHINTNHPLQFTHNHAIMHLFVDVKRSDAFNQNLYPQTARASEYRPYEHSFIDGHVLKESAIYYKSPCSYTIIGPSVELEGIKTDMNYYLSVCDASLLRIDGQGYIYLQSRGAF